MIFQFNSISRILSIKLIEHCSSQKFEKGFLNCHFGQNTAILSTLHYMWALKFYGRNRVFIKGNPLGPAIFPLGLQPLLDSLGKDFLIRWVCFYLDDGHLQGTFRDLERSIGYIAQMGVDMGLSLNLSKCVILSGSPVSFSTSKFPFLSLDLFAPPFLTYTHMLKF